MVVGLHMWLERASGLIHAAIERYHARLDAKVRTWPRTAENGPFHAASQELAARLSQETECEVIVGYNEFCSPSLDEALDQAATRGPEQIIVVTPMMTAGGEYAEEDIPAAIQRAQKRHSVTKFTYAWSFKSEDVARFLATQIVDRLS